MVNFCTLPYLTKKAEAMMTPWDQFATSHTSQMRPSTMSWQAARRRRRSLAAELKQHSVPLSFTVDITHFFSSSIHPRTRETRNELSMGCRVMSKQSITSWIKERLFSSGLSTCVDPRRHDGELVLGGFGYTFHVHFEHVSEMYVGEDNHQDLANLDSKL